MSRRPLSTHTLRNLMISVLGYEEEDIELEGHTFKSMDMRAPNQISFDSSKAMQLS